MYNLEFMCLGLFNDSNNDEEIYFNDGLVGLVRFIIYVFENNIKDKNWKFICSIILYIKFTLTVGYF